MVRLNVTVAILAIILAVAMVETKLMNVRRQIPPKFELLDRASADQVLEFSLALKQYNMDVLEATLLDISNPESVNYGKWWTTEQILDLIAPSIEEVKPVVAWLKSHGVEQIDVSGRDVIKAKAPIRIIEKLFQTEMHNFKSTETGKIVARAFGEVHVADNLHAVEAVMGITELVPKSYVKGSGLSDLKRNVEQDLLGYIYPGLLRKMYQIPATFNVNPKSSFAVVEYQDDPSFTQPDLAIFNQQMNENAKVQKIVGPYAIKNPDVESTLDVQVTLLVL
jgi:subtilase family serine protease